MSLKLVRRGEIWHYTGTVAGRRIRGSTKTSQKVEAERIANARESRELKGRRDGPGSILTFAQASMEYRKSRIEPRYLEMVEDYWKDTLVQDITRGAIKRGALTLFPKGKGATRNRSFIVPTLAVINAAAELELCAPVKVNWFPVVKVYKEPATWEWVQAFMANASPHLGGLACFMFATGARISEALAVRWEDVDLSAARATIRQGKLGGEERRAHLPVELVAAIANIERQGDTVFQYASRNSAKFPWLHAAQRAGIKPLSFHCCRHGFATAMLHAGVDVITVAKLGGWKSAQHVFSTYGHAMSDDTLADRITGGKQASALNMLADKLLKQA